MPGGIYPRTAAHNKKLSIARKKLWRTKAYQAKMALRDCTTSPIWRKAIKKSTSKWATRIWKTKAHREFMAGVFLKTVRRNGNPKWGVSRAQSRMFEQLKETYPSLVMEYPVLAYRIDICHVKRKLAIELDGPFHNDVERKKKDKKRDRRLRRLGWKIIRLPIYSTSVKKALAFLKNRGIRG